MTNRAAGATTREPEVGQRVAVAPLRFCLRLMPVLVAWAVVLAGRGVCLLAQRVPPIVRLVRACRRWLADRDHPPG